MLDIQEPPAQYQNYKGSLLVLDVGYNHLNIVCRLLNADPARKHFVLNGCSILKFDNCLVLVPKIENYITADDQSKVLRHEMAHCAGWKHD